VLQGATGALLEEDSSHPLPAGVRNSRNVYLVDPGMAVIDANAALADRHRSGVLVKSYRNFAGTNAFRQRPGH